jgi:putative oxidoreductase
MRELIVRGSRAFLALADSLDWLAPLLLRLVFGYFWLETGWYKLHNIAGATQRFVEWGIPFPGFSAPFSAATELVGGALIMLGLFTRLIAVPMAINMVVAIALVQFANLQDVNEFFELDEVLYILVFRGCCLPARARPALTT